MHEEMFDKKTNCDIIGQEGMPPYLILELPAIMKWVAIMFFILTLTLFCVFTFVISDVFLLTVTFFVGIIVILLVYGIGLPLAIFVRSLESDQFMIKYSVVNDHIIVSNVKSDVCIFNFHLSEVLCIESTYNKSRYLNHVNEKMKIKHNFVFCDKRCLLISSSRDEYAQLIPVGYSDDSMSKLKDMIQDFCCVKISP